MGKKVILTRVYRSTGRSPDRLPSSGDYYGFAHVGDFEEPDGLAAAEAEKAQGFRAFIEPVEFNGDERAPAYRPTGPTEEV